MSTYVDGRQAVDFTSGGSNQQGFSGNSILEGDRYHVLDRLQSYYDCTQHDFKRYDFEGRATSSTRVGIPLMSGTEKAAWYVPLSHRRPSTTYRLARLIVDQFTNLLFGEGRFPAFNVAGDLVAQDFAAELIKAQNLAMKMIQARKLGGCMGSVGLSWGFVDGKPRTEVHNAKNLFIHEWADRGDLVPAHVTEVYLYDRSEWDGKTYARVLYWFRRDWLLNADVVFKPVRYVPGIEPNWEIDVDRSAAHDDGFCHFVWVQNMPSDDVDGIPDTEGLYETFDSLDQLFSIVTRGATLNLDPTLKLKLDPEMVSRVGVSKGSDNALVLGKDGDAEYLELGGQSLDAGVRILQFLRKTALEVAMCIVPDPETVAAQGVSSVAIKTMFAPMIAKSGIHRAQYGAAIEKLIAQQMKVARAHAGKTIKVRSEDGEEVEAISVVKLPKKIVSEMDHETGIEKKTVTERTPGEGDAYDLKWPDYFAPTQDDLSKTVQNLSTANGGKAVISQRTSVELAAGQFGFDANEELRRIEADKQSSKAEAESQFPSDHVGGAVGEDGSLPPGATAFEKMAPAEEKDDEEKEPVKDEA